MLLYLTPSKIGDNLASGELRSRLLSFGSNGLGSAACRFGQPLGRPTGRCRQNALQFLGREDFLRAFFVDRNNLFRQLRPNAANGTGGEILFDSFGRSRMGRREFVGFELLSVLPVDDPATTCLDMLARRGRCGAAHDGDKIITSLDLHP